MPTNLSFTLGNEDGTLVVPMIPPTNISGWTLNFVMYRRQQYISGYVSGMITKSSASGYNNVSGLNTTNGIQGVFNVSLNKFDVSGGLDPGVYYYNISRLDSGNASILVEGNRLVP